MDRGVDWAAGNSQHSQCSLCDCEWHQRSSCALSVLTGKEKVYGSIP